MNKVQESGMFKFYNLVHNVSRTVSLAAMAVIGVGGVLSEFTLPSGAYNSMTSTFKVNPLWSKKPDVI